MATKHPVPRSTARVIGRAIREARESCGWTTYGLAARAHVSYNSVTGWEAGEVVPDLGTLLHLVDVLGLCSVDELLGGRVGLKEIRRAAASPVVAHAKLTAVSRTDGGAA